MTPRQWRRRSLLVVALLAAFVLGQTPGWLEVRLATRPNGSTAWVRSADVSLTYDPYRIEVNLSTRHVRLLRGSTVLLDVQGTFGSKRYPTPTGSFFVALLARAPDASYGPFVLVTSAHSRAIANWQGSGDAIIGIHGLLGGAASHGCIQLPLRELEQFRQVPAGTPITIT